MPARKKKLAVLRGPPPVTNIFANGVWQAWVLAVYLSGGRGAPPSSEQAHPDILAQGF